MTFVAYFFPEPEDPVLRLERSGLQFCLKYAGLFGLFQECQFCPIYTAHFGQRVLPVRGPGLEVKKRILERVATRPRSVWTPVDFIDLGARAAVDKALQRLVADGALRRIERGLYDRPVLNSLTGQPGPPLTRAVIDAVARRDQARLVVDGMTAANDLGLTTAVPAQVEVLTDARLRPIQLGAQQIRFRQGAPSRLYWAGRPGMRFVQALYWLQDTLNWDRDAIVRQLRNVLARDDSGSVAADLRNGLHAMPIWMQSVAREVLTLEQPETAHPDDSQGQEPSA